MRINNRMFVCLTALAVGITAFGLLRGLDRRARRAAIPAQDLSCGPVIALTFDDGPNARHTPQLLDVLYETQTPATFFVVGDQIDGQERLLREIADSGHEIGSHTNTHVKLTQITEGQARVEMEAVASKIRQTLDGYEPRFVRPPYGEYPQWMEEAPDLELALWTMDSGDWLHPNADLIVERVLSLAKDGDVVVLHDDNPATVEAVARIIPALKEKGFRFATLRQMEQAGYTVTR